MATVSQQTQHQQELRERFDAHQVNSLKHQQESLVLAMSDVRKQITTTLSLHTDQVNKQLENLTTSTHKKLTEISQKWTRVLKKPRPPSLTSLSAWPSLTKHNKK